MSKETHNELLRLVSDPTRFQILIILLNGPAQNPADLAKQLGLTRPGIEKHLKMLRAYWLIEREVESWPSPRFVYGLTQVGRDFLHRLTDLFDSYTHETCGSIVSEIESIEKKFILGKIKRPQYEEELNELKKAQKIFENK